MRRALLAILILALPAIAQERSLYFERYDTSARLDADGVLHVTETLSYVFDGEWNGGERGFVTGINERIHLDSIERLAPEGPVPLRQGDLSEIDTWQWSDSDVLRWRSRMPEDPPFSATPITYRIRYRFVGAVRPRPGGESFHLDFAMAPFEPAGEIRSFSWSMEVDPAWRIYGSPRLEGVESPFRPVSVVLDLEHVSAGWPAAVPRPLPVFAIAAVIGGLLLLVALLFRSFMKGERRKGRFDPLGPATIDREWLDEYVFRFPPEVVGAAWDESTGSAEVAAMLARMTQEGKLSSRVEEKGRFTTPDLHLELLVPRDTLPPHERALVASLFVKGKNQTSTSAIRKHYSKKGFDPAKKIRKSVAESVGRLAEKKKEPSGWKWIVSAVTIPIGLLLMLGGILLGSGSDIVAAAAGTAVMTLFLILGAIAAGMFQSRVARYTATGSFMAFGIAGVLLVVLFVAWSALTIPQHLLTLTGLASVAVGFVDLIFGTARYRSGREWMEMRRRLVRARQWMEEQLRSERPQLEDAWFPYLLAFGLGSHIDRWFRSFAGAAASTSAISGSSPTSSMSSGSSSWSGGGGAFGGAGASGAWGVAAAGMASGVTAARSGSSGGGGGGGGSSSGGGSAGGW